MVILFCTFLGNCHTILHNSYTTLPEFPPETQGYNFYTSERSLPLGSCSHRPPCVSASPSQRPLETWAEHSTPPLKTCSDLCGGEGWLKGLTNSRSLQWPHTAEVCSSLTQHEDGASPPSHMLAEPPGSQQSATRWGMSEHGEHGRLSLAVTFTTSTNNNPITWPHNLARNA